MDTIEFIFILGSFGTVLFWYIENAKRGADGTYGLLALTKQAEPPKARRKSYRIRQRHMPGTFAKHQSENSSSSFEPLAAYRNKPDSAKMRQQYRRQDEARYRVKDKAASYKPRRGPTAA